MTYEAKRLRRYDANNCCYDGIYEDGEGTYVRFDAFEPFLREVIRMAEKANVDPYQHPAFGYVTAEELSGERATLNVVAAMARVLLGEEE